MAMSDCDNCWDTPCTCGWDYLRWIPKDRQDLIQVLQDVGEFLAQRPNPREKPIYMEEFNEYMDERSKQRQEKEEQVQ